MRQFCDSLDPPTTDPSKRPRVASGTDNVQGELEVVNRQYLELLAELNHRLKALKAVHEQHSLYFPVSVRITSSDRHCKIGIEDIVLQLKLAFTFIFSLCKKSADRYI